MKYFLSKRERKLWIWVLVILVGILLTLIFGRPFAGMLRERGLLSNSFWFALILFAVTIIFNGLRKRPGKTEIIVWLGIAAVYLLVILRMASPEERSHLIEYGILAVFIHEALMERKSQGGKVRFPALVAILLSTFIGVLDECVQIFLPNRRFDPIDILFNGLASLMTVLASLTLAWARRRVDKWQKSLS